jgi:hypothetical protein
MAVFFSCLSGSFKYIGAVQEEFESEERQVKTPEA